MEFENLFHYVNMVLEVCFLDLLLSGDNAVVIALACRTLPAAQMRKAMTIGTGVAIVLRIVLTAIASFLLSLPLLKLAGGMALSVIAIKLIIEENEDGDGEEPVKQSADLWSAVSTIIVADIVMSVDNVVGLAAATQGNLLLLTFGLLISVPLLMFGSVFVTNILSRYPFMIRAGGALLGWIAGDIAISDPIFADWVNQQAPALNFMVPLLVAVFVLKESRIIEEARTSAEKLRPRKIAKQAQISVLHPGLPESSGSELARENLDQQSQVTDVLTANAVNSESGPDKAEPVISSDNAIVPVNTIQVVDQGTSAKLWITVTLIAFAAVIGFVLVRNHWMPAPTGLNQYICPVNDTVLYYRHGGNSIRMRSAHGQIEGVMDYDNIDWGDYDAATRKLGAAPPTTIKYGDLKLVRIDGGKFIDMACLAH